MAKSVDDYNWEQEAGLDSLRRGGEKKHNPYAGQRPGLFGTKENPSTLAIIAEEIGEGFPATRKAIGKGLKNLDKAAGFIGLEGILAQAKGEKVPTFTDQYGSEISGIMQGLDTVDRYLPSAAMGGVLNVWDYMTGDKRPSFTRPEDLYRVPPVTSKEMLKRGGINIGDGLGFVLDTGQSLLSPTSLIPGVGAAKAAKAASKLNKAQKAQKAQTLLDNVDAPVNTSELSPSTAQNILDNLDEVGTSELSSPNPGLDLLKKMAGGAAGTAAHFGKQTLKRKPIGFDHLGKWLQKRAYTQLDRHLDIDVGLGPNAFTNWMKKNNINKFSLKGVLDSVEKGINRAVRRRKKIVDAIPENTPVTFDKANLRFSGKAVTNVNFENFMNEFVRKADLTENLSENLLKDMEELLNKVQNDLIAANRASGNGAYLSAITNKYTFQVVDESLKDIGAKFSAHRLEVGNNPALDKFQKAIYKDLRTSQREFLEKVGGKKVSKAYDDLNKELDLLVNSNDSLKVQFKNDAGTGSTAKKVVSDLTQAGQLAARYNFFTIPQTRFSSGAYLGTGQFLKGAAPVLDKTAFRAQVNTLSEKPDRRTYEEVHGLEPKNNNNNKNQKSVDDYDWGN